MNTPVDPDKLRTRLTQAVDPIKPSPDALVQIRSGVRRRRRLQWTSSGAGIVAVAGAAAAVIGLGSLGHPTAVPRTAQPGYSPSAGTSPTTTSPATTTQPSAAASPSLAAGTPGAAVTTSSVAATSAATSAAATKPGDHPVAHDVDGDGMPDTAETVFAPGIKAHLVLHLASGPVTGPTFRLSSLDGSGATTLTDVNGDGRAEILVKAIGGTGTPYFLFQYVDGALVLVPSLVGAPSDPPLFSGGGGVGEGHRFDCVAGHIENAGYEAESSTINGALSDRRFDFTVERLTLVDGHLHAQSSQQHGLTLQQAQSQLAQHPDGRCGAPL